MCCFSPVAAAPTLFARLFRSWASPAVRVAHTSIFARFADGGDEQCLVYSMELSVAADVAMILPLPVVSGAGERGATFVNLEGHADFFDELRALFAAPPPKGGVPLSRALAWAPRQVLEVHQVGSFEASFVPTQRDFTRLDPRFRLPERVWRSLGDYDDWGFAVFRLKAGRKMHIHPMALRFRSRDRARLFFPTVHVHDGEVHDEARFDHALYYQHPSAETAGRLDVRSFEQPRKDCEGLVAKGRSVYRRELRGKLPNRDTWIEAA
jgi:hypothetical protein